MKIVIVEDERPIARYIERLTRKILGEKIQSIRTLYTLDDAKAFLLENPIDLCLLDLNLNGENGYELLKQAVSGSFHTIIISAYPNQAIEAFKYGVLDFIEKPFTTNTIEASLCRLIEHSGQEGWDPHFKHSG